MDEPTAALNGSEVVNLLGVVKRLRTEGRAIIYVSHHLEEVFQVADRVTVLRDGKNVATTDVAATDETKLVHLMVGRDVAAVTHRDAVERGDVVLSIKDLTAGLLRDVELDVHAGEDPGYRGRGWSWPIRPDPGDLRRAAAAQGQHGTARPAFRPADPA